MQRFSPTHILNTPERDELRRRLPPTPLPEELMTPSTFSSQDHFVEDDIPVHRRIFPPGRNQDHPTTCDYFSPRPTPSITRSVVQPQSPSFNLLRDIEFSKDGEVKRQVPAVAGKVPPHWGWKAMYHFECILAAVIIVLALKLSLSFVVMAVIGIALAAVAVILKIWVVKNYGSHDTVLPDSGEDQDTDTEELQDKIPTEDLKPTAPHRAMPPFLKNRVNQLRSLDRVRA